jgi:uncharacterized protein (DUF1778 family)
MDLSAFMIASAMERARAVLRDHASISLSAEGQARLVDLITTQPGPTDAMVALRKMPRLKVRR